MANGTWKRSTTTRRQAKRQVRYAHVSVQVGVSKDPESGMIVPIRTEKGSGSTAKRARPKRRALQFPQLSGKSARRAMLKANRRMRSDAADLEAFGAGIEAIDAKRAT